MKLIGMMPVRNEDWCLGLSLRVALMWCDEMVLLNHASTDQSEDIMREVSREHPGRVCISRNMDGTWKEFEHRQVLLQMARQHGATDLAIVDADEVITPNLTAIGPWPWVNGDWPPIGLYEPGYGQIIQLPGYNLRNGINQYHNNGVWGNRWFSTTFRDDPALGWQGEGFHHREPHGMRLKPYQFNHGGVMHLWGASERRLIAKHALYKITERIMDPRKDVAQIDHMYSLAIHGSNAPSYGTPATWTYADVPEGWWKPYAHLMKHLHLDAVPWQEAECKRLVDKYGRDWFTGLDLFGVV